MYVHIIRNEIGDAMTPVLNLDPGTGLVLPQELLRGQGVEIHLATVLRSEERRHTQKTSPTVRSVMQIGKCWGCWVSRSRRSSSSSSSRSSRLQE